MIEHLAGNTPAVRFWKHVVTRYCGEAHEQHVEKSSFGDTVVLRFDNRARGDGTGKL